MTIDLACLPEDVEALKALVRQQAAELASKSLKIEQLQAQLHKLRRMQFGRSSEKLDREIEQLELLLEDLQAQEAQQPGKEEHAQSDEARRPARRPLPETLPYEEIVHQAACACPHCGGELRRLGEDVTKVLEYVPASFKVIRHVRPKFSCRVCEAITQAPMPSLPIERGKPGPGLIAHVLVSKYGDHLPLYRQSEIYGREGIDLERSTMADWVGRAAALLEPLVEALRKDVMASDVLHGDDTPVPVLEPGRGKTKTGRIWTYVRDERPYGGSASPAAVYFYSPDRKGEHPANHLKTFKGCLHADGYAGFQAIFDKGDITESACWAHLWMPPLLQGLSFALRQIPRLQSSIRPVVAKRLASPALMVNPQANAQSRVTSSKLDAPNGFMSAPVRPVLSSCSKRSSHPRRRVYCRFYYTFRLPAGTAGQTFHYIEATPRSRVPFYLQRRLSQHSQAAVGEVLPTTANCARAIA